MRKSDKKLDNKIRIALTQACEIALKEFDGFEWLTHVVNYENFPKSLKIVCVFETNEQLARFEDNMLKTSFISIIDKQLLGIELVLKNLKKHVVFDTEENCHEKHGGNWAQRLTNAK